MPLTNENFIQGLPRRPRMAEASQAAILGAIALGILTGGWGGALIGGLAGGALANQPQPLEMAIREYLKSRGFEVSFYYPAPQAVKVPFRYGPSAYWTIEAVLPDNLQLSPEDTADWLYGNLVQVQLPKVLPLLKRAS